MSGLHGVRSMTGLSRRHILALGALTLSACQTAPIEDLPKVEAPAQWALGEGSAASLADRPWATIFALPELDALIAEALTQATDLRLAVARIELARAQFGLEESGRLPSLQAGASASRQRTPGAHPSRNSVSESASLALTLPAWEIDVWGRLAARTEAARRELLASQAQAQAVRVSLAAQVSTLYLDLLDLDQQQAITRRTLDSRQQSLRITRARYTEGVSSVLDVRQAESALAATQQAEADLQRRLALAEHALSTLLGRNPGPVPRQARLETLEPTASATAGLPSALLERRPDILAAEEALRAAAANVDAARKAFLPTISLSTLFGLASPQLGSLFDSGRYAWSVQPAVSVPLFNTGRLRAGVEAAQAQQLILVEQYRAAIRQAFREVNDALVSLEQLARQRTASRAVVTANEQRLRVLRARYLAGITSHFEVLDAERQLFDSELGLSQLTRAHHQALVQLYRALGGGWRRDAA